MIRGRHNQKKREPSESSGVPWSRRLTQISLCVLVVTVIVVSVVALDTSDPGVDARLERSDPDQPTTEPVRVVVRAASHGTQVGSAKVQPQDTTVKRPRTVWQLLALPDDELERVDLVELNLAVAQEIPGAGPFDLVKHQRVVDRWAEEIAEHLARVEPVFYRESDRWNDDIHLFRLGQMAWYMHHRVRIQYIPELKNDKQPVYGDPKELLLHGLTDEKLGTCGNMATLYVAIGRRFGWPVSLACVDSHSVCRFDNGEVVHNVEATHPNGALYMPSDTEYATMLDSPTAIEQGSDLRSLSARETLALFIGLRARYFKDTGQSELADQSYALARALFPRYRAIYAAAMWEAVKTGDRLFDHREPAHPYYLGLSINSEWSPRRTGRGQYRIPTHPETSTPDPTEHAQAPWEAVWSRAEEVMRTNRERQSQLATPWQPFAGTNWQFGQGIIPDTTKWANRLMNRYGPNQQINSYNHPHLSSGSQ